MPSLAFAAAVSVAPSLDRGRIAAFFLFVFFTFAIVRGVDGAGAVVCCLLLLLCSSAFVCSGAFVSQQK